MDKKPEAVLAEYRSAAHKLTKAKILGITPDMSEEAQDELVENLAMAKALQNNKPVDDYIGGQRWYVESLIEAVAMNTKDLYDKEYKRAWEERAEESELLANLDKLR